MKKIKLILKLIDFYFDNEEFKVFDLFKRLDLFI